ncbi:alpha/beta-Hydrolases superfamily protein [Actinidia rufa]|uniref:Alpha/beta-Hydrolases superfamily protein n=1 Tax=Actinidia rufa TaxID=165716 RepID=A0A7J0GJZ2_9ERIC|nr:alpha/beta-Hydrolases superfamily protein [Actinidia rufa]
MSEVTGSKSWREEFMSLMEDTGIRYTGDAVGISTAFEAKRSELVFEESAESESLKDQVKGFAKAWGEMVVELGKGCKDIVQQNFLTEDSYVVQKLRGPVQKVSGRLSFLNGYLPEDRDPFHAWSVIIFVFLFAFAALNVNNGHDSSVPLVKKVRIHPPSGTHILLPDGRRMAYREQGVPSNRARYSFIAPHGFLSSRLAGIPGVEESLLEEFGVHLVTYDLPGFGESDPHPKRNLNSSALDMEHLANAVGVSDKFWVLGFSSGSMHAWAALKYIPNRIAGAALFAPMVNPYESSMTKEETSRTWEKWIRRRKLMYYLARRFPKFLNHFYRRTFLSGKHGQIDKWLSLSLGNRDKALTEGLRFKEFWHRDVEESIRQLNAKPFIEEAVLQVSDWGFKLADLQVQKKCPGKGIFPWFKFMYSQAECELTGFLGPIHLWQGMEDEVVPPAMTDYVARVLPSAVVHKLPDEGHFSYFIFCDECHRQIFSALVGSPQGPLGGTTQSILEVNTEELWPHTDYTRS